MWPIWGSVVGTTDVGADLTGEVNAGVSSDLETGVCVSLTGVGVSLSIVPEFTSWTELTLLFWQHKPRNLGNPNILWRFSWIFKESNFSTHWISPLYKKLTRNPSSSLLHGHKTSNNPQQLSLVKVG